MAGIIVEPIQSEGGDRAASFGFYEHLRNLALEENVFYIVDEVQTGGGISGKWWAHEHWNLSTPPDVVTFAKKMSAAGFYYGDNLANNWGPVVFNTWVGDPARLIILDSILKTVEDENLCENAKTVGDFLKTELEVCHYNISFELLSSNYFPRKWQTKRASFQMLEVLGQF